MTLKVSKPETGNMSGRKVLWYALSIIQAPFVLVAAALDWLRERTGA